MNIRDSNDKIIDLLKEEIVYYSLKIIIIHILIADIASNFETTPQWFMSMDKTSLRDS